MRKDGCRGMGTFMNIKELKAVFYVFILSFGAVGFLKSLLYFIFYYKLVPRSHRTTVQRSASNTLT